MAKEEKNSKSKGAVIRIIIGLIIIIIALSVLSTMLNKFKRERQIQKTKTYNRNQNERRYTQEQIQRERAQENYGIGSIDIPDLFGTRIPSIKEEKQENTQGIEKKKNTKEEEITETESNDNILPKENKTIDELRRETLKEKNKLLNKYDNKQKKAKNMFVIGMIQKITFPILIVIFFMSYAYEIAFGLRAKKNWKNGIKIRIVTVILLFVTQVLPYVYSVII